MSGHRKRHPVDLVDRIRDQALAAKRQRVPVEEEPADDSTVENSTPDSGPRRSARLRTRTTSTISYKEPEEDDVEIVEDAQPGLQALNERNHLPTRRRAKASGSRREKGPTRRDVEDVEPPQPVGSRRGSARRGTPRQPAVAPAPASARAGSAPGPGSKRREKPADRSAARQGATGGSSSLPEVERFPLDAVEAEMALSRFDVGTQQLGETGKDGTTLLVTDRETGEKLAMKQFKVRRACVASVAAAATGPGPRPATDNSGLAALRFPYPPRPSAERQVLRHDSQGGHDASAGGCGGGSAGRAWIPHHGRRQVHCHAQDGAHGEGGAEGRDVDAERRGAGACRPSPWPPCPSGARRGDAASPRVCPHPLRWDRSCAFWSSWTRLG